MTCDKNSQKITQMFDEISNYYDKMNNLISLGTHYLIKKIALKNLAVKPESYILDLCCGTGDFTKIFSQIAPETKVIGLDKSIEMLKLAKEKNPHEVFIQGDCTSLPFGENEFDYITIGFGLRNVENRKKAISEIYKTLKSGGKFLHLDFGRHGFGGKIFDAVVLFVINTVGRLYQADNNCKVGRCCYTENYKYLIRSKNEYPEPDKLIKEFEIQGFKFVKRKDLLLGAISYQIMQK